VSEPEEDNETRTSAPSTEGAESGFIGRIMRALELTQGVEIVRRYLAMNAFDGALTMLGLILGGLLTMDPVNPDLVFNSILLAAIGTNVAMAVSGLSGTYLAESAERDREVEEIGRAMLSDMSDSMYAKATRTTSVVVALIDSLSPAGAAFIIIIPLMMVPFGLIGHQVSFFAAIIVCMILLFLLGLFLGKVSKKNILKYGAKTLLAGIVTAFLMLFISFLTGA
jgi:predicted membrane protein (TIGR00267 family)